ncbi:uncharacterized protein PV09_04267 [Verruconis gallopava]|uniref:Uncharacterized protein n=1 Tax=Verruconis gallopava TaxID=253628 RepID=A0A0D1YV59_9PEZI|nr:uncharacterized protein PV09_04267 [Verruconis gallopava]KIW04512.1 hypothetical protein PV09_04267 [Verruconis gallopava]
MRPRMQVASRRHSQLRSTVCYCERELREERQTPPREPAIICGRRRETSWLSTVVTCWYLAIAALNLALQSNRCCLALCLELNSGHPESTSSRSPQPCSNLYKHKYASPSIGCLWSLSAHLSPSSVE